MKRKNKIEQELDRKEFENELSRDLNQKYHHRDMEELLSKDINTFVIGVMHFFATLIFFELLYWLLKTFINTVSMDFTALFFIELNIFIHAAVVILAISSSITKKSPIEYVLRLMPNGF